MSLMTVSAITATDNGRRATVPAISPAVKIESGNPPPVENKTILVKAGDTLDVGIKWGTWLDANDGEIAASVWAAHADTPQAPTLVDDGYDGGKREAVVNVDASAATVGDIYYLENTVTVNDATPNSGTFAYGTRTLKRVIYVEIVY